MSYMAYLSRLVCKEAFELPHYLEPLDTYEVAHDHHQRELS
jgi:hypothetical protein